MSHVADLETTINRAVAGALSNKLAAFGAVTVSVVFDREKDEMVASKEARGWTIGAPEVDFDTAAPHKGDTVAIDGVSYNLVNKDTDPSGWTTWKVRRA